MIAFDGLFRFRRWTGAFGGRLPCRARHLEEGDLMCFPFATRALAVSDIASGYDLYRLCPDLCQPGSGERVLLVMPKNHIILTILSN